MKSKPKQLSGGRRLLDAGKVPVTLGLDPEDAALLRAAADLERRPLTQFLLVHALAAAQRLLNKNSKKS